MKLFISAPSEQTFFLECVKEVAVERQDDVIFCPEKFRDLKDRTLLEKVSREMDESHLLLMDLTMKKENEEWHANSGVLIEYGLLLGIKNLEYVFMFCEESTDRDKLPPLIPRTEVTPYSTQDRDSFKKQVKEAIEKFEREAPERERRRYREANATRTLLRGYLSDTRIG